MKNTNKEVWKQQNKDFLQQKSKEADVLSLGDGILYKVIEVGTGSVSPVLNSVVTCHYKGSLVDGSVFDNSYERCCPDAFRCRDLIAGFSAALLRMHVGDRWEVYIPFEQGYGTRKSGPIPAFSTLIFEITLMAIG